MVGVPGHSVGLRSEVSCTFVSHDKLYPEEGSVQWFHWLISVQPGESLHVQPIGGLSQDFLNTLKEDLFHS